MTESWSAILAGLGLGIALAGAPGPVQAILMAESLRGGVGRGFRAMLGATLTFGSLLIALALGVSIAVPSDPLLRVLKLIGGVFIIFLGVDGFRSANALAAAPNAGQPRARGVQLPPAARGALAVLLNPPAWLFLATAASSLLASATQTGGTRAAILAALALLSGVAVGDSSLVLASGLGLRRARSDIGRNVRRGLSIVLVILGASVLVSGLT